MTSPKDGRPILRFASQSDWDAWLSENGATCEGIWLQIAKKGSGVATVNYAQAVESALCHGWIDGQIASFDDQFFLQRFTPRRARSKWSRINVAKANALIEGGKMRASGLAQIEAAKLDGRWDAAYEPASTIQVPPDLQERLDASPKAAEFFKTLTGANRYAILYRIHNVKKPETRARKINEFIAMLEEGRTIH